MAESYEVKEKKSGEKFTDKDFKLISEQICSDYDKRKKDRKHLEQMWKEVDRQIKMKPNRSIKMNADGSIDKKKAWMSELELPNQRQALEVLNADARRLLWPDAGSWFDATGETTDALLRVYESRPLMTGDENDTISTANQDIVNEVIESWVIAQHRSYDFRHHFDLINLEAFKYGTGVGRAKMVKVPYFNSEIRVPQLIPCSIRNTYLDTSKYSLAHEGINIKPGVIRKLVLRYEDLALAAKKGGKDPNNEEGGWITKFIPDLKPDDDKDGVELLEWEGDLVVSRDSESLFVPNVIVTVARSKQPEGETAHNVVRFRFKKSERCSYIVNPYHIEDVNSPYGVGPLMMGAPIQNAASMALNRGMDTAILSADPTLVWDPDDPELSAAGGPVLTPGGSIPTNGSVQELAPGNLGEISALYQNLLQQYADLTGINAARIGQQTKSHTTAFSKDQEIERGQIRTVDFVKTVMQGGLQQWLHLCYEMSREELGSKTESILMQKSRGFIDVKKDMLPEKVFFDVYGSAGPQQDAAKAGSQVQAMQLALSIEPLKLQLGKGEPLDLDSIQKEFLKKGGVVDVDKFYGAASQGVPGATQAGADVAQAGAAGFEGTTAAGLQAVLQRGEGF